MRGLPPEHYPADLERVPTAADLASRGLAQMVGGSKESGIYRISAEGHALMGAVMRRNAERMRTRRVA